MVRLPLEIMLMRFVLLRTSVSHSRGARLFFRGAALVLLLTAGVSSHADFVHLSGARTLRVVSLTIHGSHASLELLSGGTLLVARSEIESVETEPLSRELCQASPYRCQDRAMLTRLMLAASAPPNKPHNQSAERSKGN